MQALDQVAEVYEALKSSKDLKAELKALYEAQYLARGLWKLADVAFKARDCRHHVRKAWVVSLLLLLHFGRRNGVDWKTLVAVDGEGKAHEWEKFVATLLQVAEEGFSNREEQWTLLEKTALAQFFAHCFSSVDEQFIASSVMKMASLGLWQALSPSQRAVEFLAHPKLERRWKKLVGATEANEDEGPPVSKKRKVSSTSSKKKQKAESELDPSERFLVHLCDDFLATINNESVASDDEHDSMLRFIGVFLMFVTDLMSQLPSRRFLHVVLRRRRFLRRVRSSIWVQRFLSVEQGKRSADEISSLEKQLVLLESYMAFPIDAHGGSGLWDARGHRERRSASIQALQQLVFRDFRDTSVEKLAIVPVSHIADRESFADLLAIAITSPDDGQENTEKLAVALGLVEDADEAHSLSASNDLIDTFLDEYSASPLKTIDIDSVWSDTQVFPTEDDIWNNILGDNSSSIYGASDAHLFPLLPIRKLELQYLDLADYLQRNYDLCRLEAAHDIRVDLEAAIKRIDAVRSLQRSGDVLDPTIFRGFSPMAVPLAAPAKIVKVSKPALGKTCPAEVLARIELELSSNHNFVEFDAYQTREVVYLVTVRATRDEAAELMGFEDDNAQGEGFFPEEFGVIHVRAGELVEVIDSAGTALNGDLEHSPTGNDGKRRELHGRTRVFNVALDGNQYKKDLESGNLEAYEHANLLIRRDPSSNSFKAVLTAVMHAWQLSHHINKRMKQQQTDDEERDDLNGIMPSWLQDLVLGYGNPSAAQYSSIYKARGYPQSIDVPLFEAVAHGKHAKAIVKEIAGGCKLVDVDDVQNELSAKEAEAPFVYSEDVFDESKVIKAHRRDGSAPKDEQQTTLFNGAQVEAVRSGMCEGLTVVVGPSGSGKTDIGVQLALNLYRTIPAGEKIVVVAHSNEALNEFFRKIRSRQVVSEAEIVRLDQTDAKKQERAEEDFSITGRVAFLLQRRLELLNEVKVMATWVEQRSVANGSQAQTGLGESASYSCENALYFYRVHMKALVDQALALRDSIPSDLVLLDYYTKRYSNGATPVETPSLAVLQHFARVIDAYFVELQRLQAFELLQTTRQRSDMYLMHHARIVFMTCSYAAVNYSRLSDLGLTIGSIILEEASQASEIDTLIPVMLACSRSIKFTALSGASGARSSLFSDNLKRIVLFGDSQQTSSTVNAQALRTFAHLDQSLFSRLLRLGVPRITLKP